MPAVILPRYSRVSLLRNVIHNTAEAINARYCSGLIASNTIYDLNAKADGVDLDGIWGGGGTASIIVEWNVLHDAPGTGSDGVDLGSASGIVRNNIIYGFQDKGISIGEHSYPVIYNNLVSDCDIGIAVKDGSTPVMANNTIVNCNSGVRSYRKSTNVGGRGSMQNSIVWGCGTSILLLNGSTLDVSYSAIEGATVWPGLGNTAEYPDFVDVTGGNFRLGAGSLCVNAGQNMAWMAGASDLDGADRILHDVVDMGAFEVLFDTERALWMFSPRGHDIVERGVTVHVSWGAYGTNWVAGDRVSLQLSDDGGLSWSNITGASAMPYDLGLFEWSTIGYANGDQYMIRVVQDGDPAVDDETHGGPFSLQTPPVDHFEWAPIPSPRGMNIPFPVSIAAKSMANNLILAYDGSVSLAGWGGQWDQEVPIGTGSDQWNYPMAAWYEDARTQVIYLQGEIGSACNIMELALDIKSIPGQVLNNWTIRAMHTSRNDYSQGPRWEDGGWVTLYQDDERIVTNGWHTFHFSEPFEYDGTRNLMIDFSYNNSSYTRDGDCGATDSGQLRSLHFRTDSGYGDPLLWVGTNPGPNGSQYIPNIRLLTSHKYPVSITPGSATNFVEGVWVGSLTVLEPASNTFLVVDDGMDHTGHSNPFDVPAQLPLLLRVPIAVTEGDGNLVGQGHVELSVPAVSNIAVRLHSDDLSEVTVAEVVTIPAGQTNVAFDVMVVDDAILDGTHTVVLGATADGFEDDTASIAVADNETTTLSVTIVPGSAIEGVGTLVNQAIVMMMEPANGDVTVNLASDDTSEVTVSNHVLILSGTTNATFDLVIVDDGEIDYEQIAVVTAHVSGWTDGSDALTVLDNEGTNLTLDVQGQASEGDGVLPGGGRVSISGTLREPLAITIVSRDVSEVSVPVATVTIPGAQTSVTFNLLVQDDVEHDGIQTVVLEATAARFVAGQDSIAIADDDVDHLTFAAVSAVQTAGVPFGVSIAAKDVNGATIAAFTNSVNLSGSRDAGAVSVPVIPAVASPFVAGVWSGPVSISETGTAVTLTAADGGGHTGVSDPFDVVVGPLHHFRWAPIPVTQYLDATFPATVTASDLMGYTVTNYTGPCALRARLGPVSNVIDIGRADLPYPLPMPCGFADARTQVIYLQSHIGSAGTINGLSLNITQVPGMALNDWTIRLRHTSLSHFTNGNGWEDGGWTVVHQGDEPTGVVGWRYFEFATPFAYDGVDNLLVDFSYNNTTAALTHGWCTSEQAEVARVQFWISSDEGDDPMTWSGTDPAPYVDELFPCIRFHLDTPPVVLSCAASGGFTDGLWTGVVAVAEPATDVLLIASDGDGHKGISNPIDIGADGPMGTPIRWLQNHGLTNVGYGVAELADLDCDAAPAWAEYIADTDPRDSNSVLSVTDIVPEGDGLRIFWKGGEQAIQQIEVRSSLSPSGEPWTPTLTILPPTALSSNHLFGTPPGDRQFYRIRARRP
jgi:parallel beta-helix repeat protein